MRDFFTTGARKPPEKHPHTKTARQATECASLAFRASIGNLNQAKAIKTLRPSAFPRSSAFPSARVSSSTRVPSPSIQAVRSSPSVPAAVKPQLYRAVLSAPHPFALAE